MVLWEGQNVPRPPPSRPPRLWLTAPQTGVATSRSHPHCPAWVTLSAPLRCPLEPDPLGFHHLPSPSDPLDSGPLTRSPTPASVCWPFSSLQSLTRWPRWTPPLLSKWAVPRGATLHVPSLFYFLPHQPFPWLLTMGPTHPGLSTSAAIPLPPASSPSMAILLMGLRTPGILLLTFHLSPLPTPALQ